MTITRISRIVAAVLALSAGMAVATAHAQQKQRQTLVGTACAAGYENECGERIIAPVCEWHFAFVPNPLGPPSISFGFQKCSSGTRMTLYKDYIRENQYGTCVVTKFPSDDRRNDDEESGDGDGAVGDGSC